MLPLSDDNPCSRAPVVVWTLVGACVLVFLWQSSLDPVADERAIFALGVVPAALFGYASLPPDAAMVPPWATVFTSMFLHGGWLHLGGNMLYLWIFGNNIEDSMTRPRFLLFYLLCGIAAALTQSFAAPHSEVPMVGASGAIAGVLGSYLLLHPRANVRVLVTVIYYIRVVNMPAMLVLGAWFILQLVSGWATPTDQGGVAFWAHIGGFVAGMALTPLFKRRSISLFVPAQSTAWMVTPPARRSRLPDAGSPRRRDSGPWQ
jgi:rhomboid family protein